VIVLTNQRHLFSMLAESIANFYIPPDAHARDTVLDDADPKTTEKLRTLIVGLGDGKLDPTLFSEKGQKEVVPVLQDFGPVIVNQLDALSAIYLVDRKVSDSETRLVYRVVFGTRPTKWILVLQRDGKISYVEPASSD